MDTKKTNKVTEINHSLQANVGSVLIAGRIQVRSAIPWVSWAESIIKCNTQPARYRDGKARWRSAHARGRPRAGRRCSCKWSQLTRGAHGLCGGCGPVSVAPLVQQAHLVQELALGILSDLRSNPRQQGYVGVHRHPGVGSLTFNVTVHMRVIMAPTTYTPAWSTSGPCATSSCAHTVSVSLPLQRYDLCWIA